MITRTEFAHKITIRPILLDGAMGTALNQNGYQTEHCLELLNLENPAAVAQIHRAYIQAGADMIETNTFGANSFRLARYQQEARTAEINKAAVKVAREVIAEANRPILLAGSIGPLGVRLAPLGRVTAAEAEVAWREQMTALIEAGVDLLLLETFSDLNELESAINTARTLSADLPIIAFVTFARDDRTLLGESAVTVANLLAKLDVDAIGANCSGGPNQLLRLITAMHHAQPTLPVGAMPNAGWPERFDGGRMSYPATPDYFGQYARAFRDVGARLVGGCCGTTTAHIAAMRTALDDPQPSTIILPMVETVTQTADVSSAEPPTQLARALLRGERIITVEMRPPRGVSAQKMVAGAHVLREAGANFLDIADIPLARMRMSAWAAAYLVQKHTGLETILHFPTRGRNLLRVQADLLASHALGVRNLFVTMGDPSKIGDYPDATDSYDIVPTGLIQLLKSQFNQGVDKAGTAIDQPTNFTVGCAASLTPKEFEAEAKLLAKKIRLGADFALTQPVFDADRAREFLAYFREQYPDLTLPLIVGIQPLFNGKNADFLHNEVPGIVIPDHYRQRMHSADNPQEEGVRIAHEIVQALGDLAQGVYIIPAFGRYDLAAELIERIQR